MGGATKILCCYTCDLIEFYGVDFFTFVVCKIYGTSWETKKKKKIVPLSNFITKNGVKSVEKKAFLNPSQCLLLCSSLNLITTRKFIEVGHMWVLSRQLD